MAMAIQVSRLGGPEVLAVTDLPVGAPGAGEIRLRHSTIGVNFVDVYHRIGQYPLPLPFVPGMEGAGTVEAVGAGVEHVSPGDRIVYAGGPPGAYSSERLLPAAFAVPVPEGVSDEQAATIFFKALTAQYLIKTTAPVQPGDTILLHAAAGGVGLILASWARHLGATVIGTVSSDEKAELARRHGCDHVIVSSREDFVARVAEITDGAKVDTVFDSIGQDTVTKSLDCLRVRGLLVTFGSASGPAPAIDPKILGAKGSIYMTRPTIADHIREPAMLRDRARDVFAAFAEGIIPAHIGGRFALADAAEAHRAIESRKTIGSLLLKA